MLHASTRHCAYFAERLVLLRLMLNTSGNRFGHSADRQTSKLCGRHIHRVVGSKFLASLGGAARVRPGTSTPDHTKATQTCKT